MTRFAPERWGARVGVVALALLPMFASSPLRADEGALEPPPAALLAQPDADAAALERLFTSFAGIQSFEATFREEKKMALLAKPLKTTGTLYFERAHGLARHTQTPKPQKVRLTDESLSVWNGSSIEEIKLDASRDLSALALAFSRILRGDRQGLLRSFSIRMVGADSAAWGLVLTPREASLSRMLQTITVVGEGKSVRTVLVVEAGGDRTLTSFQGHKLNAARSPSDVEAWFKLP